MKPAASSLERDAHRRNCRFALKGLGASVCVTILLVLCGCTSPLTVYPKQPEAPEVAADWTTPHEPVKDSTGKVIGYRVSSYYVRHFTALAAKYGSRLSPALTGSEEMSIGSDGLGFVTVTRDRLNMDLAGDARLVSP